MSDFIDNTDKKRFEYHKDEQIVFANYRRDNETLFIDYVEAPPALRGTGAAGALMENIMKTARAENLKIKPICGYAAAWIRRHPEL